MGGQRGKNEDEQDGKHPRYLGVQMTSVGRGSRYVKRWKDETATKKK